MNYKLGANLGKKDFRNLQLAHYITAELPEPKPIVDWIGGHEKYLRMWANDQCGDCVFAAFYNMLSVATGWTDDPFQAENEDVLRDYGEVTGFDSSQIRPDGSNPTDNGANPEDALKFYSNLPEGDQRKIIAYGEVNRHDLTEVRAACEIFGGVYTALALPKTAEEQIGKIWDIKPGWGYDRIPGSWGGHMVLLQYLCEMEERDSNVIGSVDTWGTTQKFTKKFWKKYCFSAYFFITEKWIADITGKTPGGLDLDTLLNDVQILKNS